MIDMAVGQSIDAKTELIWWGSYICPYCGSQVEIDGKGLPEDEIREAILRAEGKWALSISAQDKDLSKALSVLKNALNLDMPRIAKLKKLIPGEVYVGTKTEVKRLKLLLERQEISSHMENIS